MSGEASIRHQEARQILDRLQSTELAGVVITGPSGGGKSTLLDAVVQAAEETHNIVRHALTPALREIPGGIGLHLAPGYPLSGEAVPVAILNACRRYIHSGVDPEKPTLLVLDNLQHADDLSLWLVTQLAETLDLQVVGTHSAETAFSPDLQELVTEGTIGLHALRPLTLEAATAVMGAMLGGAPALSLAHEVHALAQGNPLLMRAILEEASLTGAIANRDGVWVGMRPIDTSGRRLRELMERRMGRYTPAERRIVEILSLAEPLPLATLERLVESAALSGLYAAGVIAVRNEPPRNVTLSSSLEAEVVYHTIALPRSVALRTEVLHASAATVPPAERIESEAEAPEGAGEAETRAAESRAAEPRGTGSLWETLRRVEFSLDCGLHVPDRLLLEAARAANDLMDPERALRLATMVADRRHQLAARTEQARAFFYERRYHQAYVLLTRVIEQEQEPARPEFVRAVCLLVHQMIPLGLNSEEELRVVRDAAERFRAAARLAVNRADHPLNPKAHKKMLDRMTVAEAAVEVRSGIWPAPDHPMLSLPDGRPAKSLEATLLRSLVAQGLAAKGRFEEAAEMSRDAVDTITQVPSATVEDAISVLAEYAGVLTFLGRFGEPEMLRAGHLNGASPWMKNIGGPIQLFRGMVLCRQGKYALGLPELRAAVSQLGTRDDMGLLPLALATQAAAGWMSGQRETVRQALERFDEVPRYDPYLPARIADCYASAARAALGQSAEAQDLLRELAHEAHEHGTTGVEQLALDLLGRLRESERPETFTHVPGAEALGRMTAELATAYAKAMAAQDGTAMLEVARHALSQGDSLLARDYGIKARDLFAAQANRLGQLQAGKLLRELGIDAGEAVLAEPPTTTTAIPVVRPTPGAGEVRGAGGAPGAGAAEGTGAGLFGPATPPYGMPVAGVPGMPQPPVYEPPTTTGRIRKISVGATQAPDPGLTARERTVGELAAAGASSDSISKKLGIAVNTVNAHLQRVYTKLGVSSRAELAQVWASTPGAGSRPRRPRGSA